MVERRRNVTRSLVEIWAVHSPQFTRSLVEVWVDKNALLAYIGKPFLTIFDVKHSPILFNYVGKILPTHFAYLDNLFVYAICLFSQADKFSNLTM